MHDADVIVDVLLSLCLVGYTYAACMASLRVGGTHAFRLLHMYCNSCKTHCLILVNGIGCQL